MFIVHEFENVEQHIIRSSCYWLCTHKLATNLTETNFMLFSKVKRSIVLRIHIDNHKIELSDYVKV